MTTFGVHTALENCSVTDLVRTWRHAEDLGFDWVSIWDHLHPAVHPLQAGSLDSIACHTALAMSTHRVRVGALVYSVGFRHPALLAKTAATIDLLSSGRMELGLGAGWFREEHEAFGFAFDPPAVRLRRLREAVEVIRMMWGNEVVDFTGEFYSLAGASCGARPVQASPRIWVGATGDRLGLAVAAEVNDGWNCSSVTPEEFARKRSIVLEAASNPEAMTMAVNVGFPLAKTGTEPADQQSLIMQGSGPDCPMSGSAEEMTDQVGRYVEAGADMVVLRLVAPFELHRLERFARDVVPRFRI